MTRFLSQVCSLLFVAITFPAWGQDSIPSGNRWLDHLKNDLLPFWTSEAALGKPVGAFPSIRCDDGTLYNYKTPCPEVGARRTPNERYLVALSRQSFGYGVAFHLTGERKYLDMMKAGIDFMRLNAMDRANGGMATTQDLSNGAWGTQSWPSYSAAVGLWPSRHYAPQVALHQNFNKLWTCKRAAR